MKAPPFANQLGFVIDAEFDESDVKRKPKGEGGGQFASQSGSGSGETSESKPEAKEPEQSPELQKALRNYTGTTGHDRISEDSNRLITGSYLERDPEWEARIKATYKWSDERMEQQIAKNKEQLESSSASKILQAIRDAPERDIPLHRGTYAFEKWATKLNGLAEGDEISMDRISSFSADRDVASKFARATVEGTIGDPEDEDYAQNAVSYEFNLVGPSKAVGVDDSYSQHKNESEYVTQGKFRIVDIKENAAVGKAKYRRSFTIEQTGVY